MSESGQIQARFLHHFPDFTLNAELELPGYGVSAIFGPSGSGKTTLLRCIAGLEKAQGQLSVKGECWQDNHSFVPAHRRPVGYVFQEASLFPHLSALGNLRYAMDRAGTESRTRRLWRRNQQDVSHASSRTTLDEAVALLGIDHLLQRHPHQLSGGERQRVAIARALLIQPRLLLMDEPLASLDLARKYEILPYLEALHQQLTIPIIYVSHSVDEITRLADYLVVLKDGQVTVAGSATETLTHPDFPLPVGDEVGVVWEGVVSQIDRQWQLAEVETPGKNVWIPAGNLQKGQALRLRVPASDVSLALTRNEDSSFLNILPATITGIRETGTGAGIVSLELDGYPLLANVTLRSIQRLRLKVGLPVWAQIKSVAVLR